MFITQQRKNNFWILEIKDNKNYLLHYFDKEIETLTLQAPIIVFIEISESDRIGFRKKLFKLFKKINKLSAYEVIIGKPDFLSVIAKQIERRLK